MSVNFDTFVKRSHIVKVSGREITIVDEYDQEAIHAYLHPNKPSNKAIQTDATTIEHGENLEEIIINKLLEGNMDAA